MLTIDYLLFFVFYNLAGHSTMGDFLIIFFAKYFLYLIFLVFIFFMYQEWRRKNISKLYSYVIAFITALIARFGVASLIRIFFHRPRPFLALNLSHLIIDNEYSFPSGHTIFLFALATVVYFFNKKLAYFSYISGVVVGFARVTAGVHYPSDIIGGALLGILTGIIVYKAWRRYFPYYTRIDGIE